MKITTLSISDVLLIEPCCFEDDRGFFLESFRQDIFQKEVSADISFVQDNHAKSFKGVLRGLHYQLPPRAQGKLVRVIHGSVLDVAVDLRQSSQTFGKHTLNILSAENKNQIWIPEGFAHGFLTLSDYSEVLYKASNFFDPEYERTIIWNDDDLNISWPKDIKIKLSSKDLSGQSFQLSELFP